MTTYRLPAQVVKLGTVLDCTLADGRLRHFVHEWKGFQLLTDGDAFDRVSGKARLYLVRGELEHSEAEPTDKASEAYKLWHKREPSHVGDLDWTPASYSQGRMVRIGYASDKWSRKKKVVEYDHDFLEFDGRAPLVYTNTNSLEAASTIVVVGGNMRITEGGIA